MRKVVRQRLGWGVAIVLTGSISGVAAQGGFQGGFPPQGGPGGGFPGGPGGGVREDIPVVDKFDADKDGWLNSDERAKARAYVKSNLNSGGMRGGGRPGGRGQGQPGQNMGGFPGGGFPGGGPMGGPMGMNRAEAKTGVKVTPNDVKNYPDATLYDTKALRTVFIRFEGSDWETELSDFHGTDVEVPAQVTVDGKAYSGVGIHFRGNSSYNMVPAGYKRSLNLSFDMVDKKSRIYGYKTLNLLNANGDPTLLRGPLYSMVAANYIPIEKTNLVKVVINGENWGIYQNVQQFDKIFLKEHFGEDEGVRWKTPGSPQAQASLAYLGDNVEAYRRIYSIKTEDEKKSAAGWSALINLTKVLNQTPTAQLPAAIEPILDVPGTLKFLALENALYNSDGYWIRTSDYNLYLDTKGKFHIIPHDFNETFLPEGGPGGGPGGGMGRPGGGPDQGGFPPPGGFGGDQGGFPPPGEVEGDQGGFPPQGGPGGGFPGGGFQGGPGGGGPGGGGNQNLDPLVAEKDARKPLISKLLAVPQYKQAYLKYVGEIAQNWLNWERIRPTVSAYRDLIGGEMKLETRSLQGYDAFVAGLGLVSDTNNEMRFGPRTPSLREFIESRRRYLLALPSVKSALAATTTPKKATPKAKKTTKKTTKNGGR